MWSTHEAKDLAREFMMGMGRRWSHVAAVGQAAEDLADADRISKTVVVAAWLHDVGYAPELVATGMHALDGARALERLRAAREVVALVGHHTGALYEAEERGLLAEWSELPTPDPDDLDVLTMLDLATGPSGQPTLADDRIAEIFQRYDRGDSVHRAVTRSQDELLASSARGKKLLGLPDGWPLVRDDDEAGS